MEQTIFNEFRESNDFQTIIENNEEIFTVGSYQGYLTPQYTSERTWTSYIASARNAPMASVIAFSADAPLRSRNVMRKASGDIPTIAHKKQMSKEDLRRFIEMQDNPMIGQTDIFGLLFNDVEEVVNGTIDRMDYLFWQAVSEGRFLLNTTNNPDGTITATEVSIGMGDDQKFGTRGATWDNTAATPIADIQHVISTYYDPKGLTVENIKMSQAVYNKMIKTTEVLAALTGVNITVGSRTIETKPAVVRLTDLNTVFVDAGLPPIVIIKKSVNVETYAKNTSTGVVTPGMTKLNPFNQYNVSFTTSDNYGRLQWTFVNEARLPEAIKSYATYESYILLKKWRANSSEFTESEALAIPVIDNVDGMALLNTNNQTTYS